MAMDEKIKYNPEIHHRRSIRLRGYDYSQCGAYFITICVQHRKCLFGKIVNGEMILNEYGKIVELCLNAISTHYQNVILDEYIIMPNHIHIIIIVGAGSSLPYTQINIGRENPAEINTGRENPAEINTGRENPAEINTGRENPAPTIGNIVGYFKYMATKQINDVIKNGVQKIFQRNYYEHIIRNENEYNNIAQYIIDNPKNWSVDKNYIGGNL